MGLADVTEQVPGRMQPRMQLAPAFVDPGQHTAGRQRAGGVVQDTVAVLDHPGHLGGTDPAGVAGLAAALGMEGRGQQFDDITVLGGATGVDLDLGDQAVAQEIQALGHTSTT